MSGCIQCGYCCKKYGMRLEATPLDIARWRLEKREDILVHVDIEIKNEEVKGGRLWVDREGKNEKECPFLVLKDDKYYCGIQDTKPEVCTWYYCDKYL
ncbi:YkgJ family cysteine cluster protein [Methanocella conradii]|uniref:YkgJ family cysteine cluster protein n=1 Tax=Methanocella conradii TaxID=1175444 RepID=UPI00157C5046|nr:YkgJ family cysteine cluster protein [Methanocella conradii]